MSGVHCIPGVEEHRRTPQPTSVQQVCCSTLQVELPVCQWRVKRRKSAILALFTKLGLYTRLAESIQGENV